MGKSTRPTSPWIIVPGKRRGDFQYYRKRSTYDGAIPFGLHDELVYTRLGEVIGVWKHEPVKRKGGR